ncbi:formate dehydrogenase cytochrome b556 subunit, partial [Serratia sp. Se-RSBMAAmG]|nr:formate dehydrogenase cytochrome b556 subunit [Serratia sp. Se-RSBMAAmG]
MKKRDRLVRYSAPERINHWIVAFCFVLAALSG